MAATAASDVSDGPVLSLINKRLRALRKKYNRILQMEESIAQGKPINKEQEEVLRTKPSVAASIDELEKLRQPLAAAVSEEIILAVQRHQVSPSPSLATPDASESKVDKEEEPNAVAQSQPKADQVVEDLLNLLYFGSMFDVRSQNDFTSTMLTRTHERGCCLTYDYVTDDETTDLLGETDLDLISMLGSLLTSRPVDSSLSHKNALQRCIEHAKHWLSNSDQPVDSDPSVTYAGLRAKLNKIMSSDYFTTSPEMKATVEMAAAAGGNYASFGSMVQPVSIPIQAEGSDGQYEHQDEDTADYQVNETDENQSSPLEEAQEGEFEVENSTESPARVDADEAPAEEEQTQRDLEQKEQHYAPRRNYLNQRGGRGGGGRRGGYPSGRGGRGTNRGRGNYQNGRNQYYDQSGNFYPRSYYNNRGRGSRGGSSGGSNFYNHNNNSSGAQNSYAPADS